MNEPSRHPASLIFESFGVRIGITLDDPDFLDRVVRVLPPGWSPVDAIDLHRRYHIGDGGPKDIGRTISIDGKQGDTFHDLERLLDFLEGDIQIHVAEFATPHLFIHAGVVEWQGRAILLPGTSFAGKSTLVTSLVNAGATYFSDEYAVLNSAGQVLPYPRRVSLRTGPHGPAGRLDLWHRASREGRAVTSIPVDLVALLTYVPDARWQVERLKPIDGLVAIMEQTVAIQRRPGDTLAILRKVVEGAPVIQGTRGEVEEAVQVLLSMDEIRA